MPVINADLAMLESRFPMLQDGGERLADGYAARPSGRSGDLRGVAAHAFLLGVAHALVPRLDSRVDAGQPNELLEQRADRVLPPGADVVDLAGDPALEQG